MFSKRLRRPNHGGKQSEETLLRLKCKALVNKMPQEGVGEMVETLQEIAAFHRETERYQKERSK